MTAEKKLPLVVLISGSGSNLQAIIDDTKNDPAVEIKAVISNKAGVLGLERATHAGIETGVLDHTAYPDRESYDQALGDLIESYQPELVVLAGFMRILTPAFVARFHGRMLNIHPSLLPNYRGLHTHRRVLEAGDKEHGASVHFVTEELDGGPLILQAQVPVLEGDNEERLGARVLTREHLIYPMVIRWFAEGILKMEGNRVIKNDKLLEKPIVIDSQGRPCA